MNIHIPKRFLGAFKAGHRHSAREFIDEGLSYQLLKKIIHSNWGDLEAIESLDYLTKFNNEYHKAVLKKNDAQAMHNTEELYKEISTANNARNRDIMSVMRHKLESLTPPEDEPRSILNISVNIHHEEIMIGLLDIKNKMAMS